MQRRGDNESCRKQVRLFMGFFPHVTTFQALPLFRAAFRPQENRGIRLPGAKKERSLALFFQVSCVFDGIRHLRLNAYIFDREKVKLSSHIEHSVMQIKIATVDARIVLVNFI